MHSRSIQIKLEYLVSKGFKPKVKVMENQATKAINSLTAMDGRDHPLLN